MDRQRGSARLPEGAEVLTLPPYEPSIELALDAAELGASDDAIWALGGDAAMEIVHEEREQAAAAGRRPVYV